MQPSCELLQRQRRGEKNNSLSFSACVLHGVGVFQSGVSLTSMREKMEAAKLELKAYSHTLTELISKIGKSAANVGVFHRRHFLVFRICESHASSLALKCQTSERARWLFMPRLTRKHFAHFRGRGRARQGSVYVNAPVFLNNSIKHFSPSLIQISFPRSANRRVNEKGSRVAL